MTSKTSQKTRNFVFTNWNLNSDEVYRNNSHIIKYFAYAEETCPTTGKVHHQGYMTFFSQRSFSKQNLNEIGKLFRFNDGDKQPNIEPMFGSLAANEKYCSKESELRQHGEPPKQGARKDLIEIRNRILTGTDVDTIAMEEPVLYHQYGRTMQKLEAIAFRKRFRTEMTKGLWYYGPTGVGKSHEAFIDFNPDTHYVKNLNEDWWDGYKGQDIVILNEFRGQIKYSELLDLLDKYPKTVKIRNQEPVPFLAKFLIITSCKHPSDCYPNCGEHMDQLYRRCEILHKNNRSEDWEILNKTL